MTTTQTKRHRAAVILECVRIAAEHFHITRDEILRGRRKARSPEHQARRLIWWHLSRHGVPEAEIARVWDRTETAVKSEVLYAFLHLIDPYAMLLRTLPSPAGGNTSTASSRDSPHGDSWRPTRSRNARRGSSRASEPSLHENSSRLRHRRHQCDTADLNQP